MKVNLKQPGIYKITNTVNGKFYFGSSKNVERRWTNHKSALRRGDHKNPILQNSWNKYGEVNFQFDVMSSCSEDDLLSHEQSLLDAHHGAPKCMNIAKDALAPMKGRKHSEDSKKLIGAASKGNKYCLGNKLSDEHKSNLSKSLTGREFSSNHKLALSESKKGENNPMYGKTHSDEARLKLSKCNSGNNHPQWGISRSEETKQKLREASLGKVHSEETKRKMSKSRTGLRYSQTKAQCPHCNKIGGASNMKRYHFDNCKLQRRDDK